MEGKELETNTGHHHLLESVDGERLIKAERFLSRIKGKKEKVM